MIEPDRTDMSEAGASAAGFALADEGHKLDTAFQKSPAAMAIWRGPDLIFDAVNPVYQAIFGDRQLLGLPLVEAIPELKGQEFPEILLEVFRTGEPYIAHEALARLAPREGGVLQDHYYDFTYVRIDDIHGKPWGVYDHATDVTDRVLTRRKNEDLLEALRASNALFNQFADNIRDVFWIRSPDFGTLRYISPAFEQIWGRSRESFYANPADWAKFVFPEDLERVRSAFHRLGSGAESVDVEHRIVRPDGEIRWVHLRAFEARDGNGEVISLLGIVRDITERRKLDAQLLQSRKHETVGRLAGGIAHEFNSILTAIIGQSEFLLNELPSESSGANRAVAILTSAERAAALTAQLVAYGRKQVLEPTIFDLNQTLARMEVALRNLTGPRVDLRIVPSGNVSAVKADPEQIEQVIVAITCNARAAMPDGGKLTLETANVSFGVESGGPAPDLEPGDYVMLAISDTGTGMAEEVRMRVFDPFFTTRSIGEGAGLGLATCEGIIRQSGGNISVYSEIGQGTVFKILLPREAESVEKMEIRQEAPPMPGGSEVILLVEDEPGLRELSARLLRRLGYEVIVADNGARALELIELRGEIAIDLLFTDLVMPLLSGTELADRVNASHPAVRTLFTSAYPPNAIVHQLLLKPGAAMLPKPFTPRALALKVREVLDTR